MANNPPHVATQADNAVCVLWCVVSREQTPFMIKAPANVNISELKEAIKEKGDNGVLGRIDAKDLVLWKVSTYILMAAVIFTPDTILAA